MDNYHTQVLFSYNKCHRGYNKYFYYKSTYFISFHYHTTFSVKKGQATPPPLHRNLYWFYLNTQCHSFG